MRQRADTLVFFLVLRFVAAPPVCGVSAQAVLYLEERELSRKTGKIGASARQSSILRWNALAGYATLSRLVT
jgi:hypothetical protein